MQLPYIGVVDTTLHNTVTLIYAKHQCYNPFIAL